MFLKSFYLKAIFIICTFLCVTIIGCLAKAYGGGGPVLGNYANASVRTAGSAVIQPAAAPTGVVRATAMTSTSFKGTLTVNPATGAVRVTNAYPAGNYVITV